MSKTNEQNKWAPHWSKNKPLAKIFWILSIHKIVPIVYYLLVQVLQNIVLERHKSYWFNTIENIIENSTATHTPWNGFAFHRSQENFIDKEENQLIDTKCLTNERNTFWCRLKKAETIWYEWHVSALMVKYTQLFGYLWNNLYYLFFLIIIFRERICIIVSNVYFPETLFILP